MLKWREKFLFCSDRKFGRHFIWILQLNANEHSCFYYRSYAFILCGGRGRASLFTLTRHTHSRVSRLNLPYRRHTNSRVLTADIFSRSLSTLAPTQKFRSDFFFSFSLCLARSVVVCLFFAWARAPLYSFKIFQIFIRCCFWALIFLFFDFCSSRWDIIKLAQLRECIKKNVSMYSRVVSRETNVSHIFAFDNWIIVMRWWSRQPSWCCGWSYIFDRASGVCSGALHLHALCPSLISNWNIYPFSRYRINAPERNVFRADYVRCCWFCKFSQNTFFLWCEVEVELKNSKHDWSYSIKAKKKKTKKRITHKGNGTTSRVNERNVWNSYREMMPMWRCDAFTHFSLNKQRSNKMKRQNDKTKAKNILEKETKKKKTWNGTT